MYATTAAQYNSIVSALTSIGFSGFPPVTEIDFAAAHPVNVNVSLSHAKITTAQYNDSILPLT